LTPEERLEFYHLGEGSEVFPLAWLKALESSKTKKPFLEEIERFGLIPDPNNLDGLPIGLSAETTRDTRYAPFGKMVGVNCAACHVSEVTYNSNRVRLDGAPGRFNIDAFFEDLGKSAGDTIKNPLKFVGFIGRVSQQAPVTGSRRTAYGLSASSRALLTRSSELTAAAPSSPRELAFQAKLAKIIEEESKQAPIDLTLDFERRSDDDIQKDALLDDINTSGSGDAKAKKPYDKLRKMLQEQKYGINNFDQLEADSASPLSAVTAGGITDFFSEFATVIKLMGARVNFLLSRATSTRFQNTPPLEGRVDAFGNARNIVFGNDTAVAPNSPVSFPHLWGLGKLNWLHWDANTNSVMERNIGQAAGLGAVVDKHSFASTLLPRNIYRLEVLARRLEPPKWPAIFPAPDTSEVSRGATVYGQNCAACHSATIDNQPELELALAAIGTDPSRAESFAAPVGPRPQSQAIAEFVKAVKERAYRDNNINPAQGLQMEWGRASVWRSISKYPSRSLAGIWASAPYLHNASVPTIHDLLKPPTDRPKYFLIDSREYDVTKVGLANTVGSDLTNFPNDKRDKVFDTSLVGNHNSGHTYGTELSTPDKKALLEYLKTI